MLSATALAIGVLSTGLACGSGGGGHTPTTSGLPATVDIGKVRERIVRNWETFFSGATPASKKERLLQNGQRYAKVLRQQSSTPVAKRTSAHVSMVAVHGHRAAVRYSLLVSGQPMLANQTGMAVESGGTWKVSEKSFCALLRVRGSAPPACSK